MRKKYDSGKIKQTGGYLLLGLSFALAYTQSPLFTSNQNQYFLHGMAKAGFGTLAFDWLANTLDPTPIFSFLVMITNHFLIPEIIFYLFYAILLGIYLYSMYGIVSRTFDFTNSKTLSIMFIALLIVVHSAMIRFIFSRTLGDNWTYILEDGVADQRLLGPVFQPSAFGAFLTLSIYLFLIKRPYTAVISAAFAAIVHPTYLLSAGGMTLAFIIVTYHEERSIRKVLTIGGLALLCVLPILFYVYTSFSTSPSEISERARDILVNFRIPHHASPDWWFDATVVVKLLLIAGGLIVVRRNSRLLIINSVLFITALSLTLFQYFTASNFLALLFPWRISVILVPLSTALLLGYGISRINIQFGNELITYTRLLSIISIVMIGIAVLVGIVRLTIDFDRKHNANFQAFTSFVMKAKSSSDNYLIPIKFQEFRLESGAPILVDFKSIPYKGEDVIEWYTRIQLANQFYKENQCEALDKIVKQYGITHVVLDSQNGTDSCAGLLQVYKDDWYRLYEIDGNDF